MDGNHSPAEPVLKRGLGQRFFQLTSFGPQVLDLIRSVHACRVTGKPTLNPRPIVRPLTVKSHGAELSNVWNACGLEVFATRLLSVWAFGPVH